MINYPLMSKVLETANDDVRELIGELVSLNEQFNALQFQLITANNECVRLLQENKVLLAQIDDLDEINH